MGHSLLSPSSCWPDALMVVVLSTHTLVVGVSPPCLGAPQAPVARCWEGSTGVSRGTGASRSHQPCWKDPNMMVLSQGGHGDPAMTPQSLPSELWIRGGGRELGLLSLAVGEQAESSPPAVAHNGMEGMDEAKPFLAAATGDATKGSGCSPGGFRLDLDNPFSPRQVSRWKVSIWAKSGTCLHCLG